MGGGLKETRNVEIIRAYLRLVSRLFQMEDMDFSRLTTIHDLLITVRSIVDTIDSDDPMSEVLSQRVSRLQTLVLKRMKACI